MAELVRGTIRGYDGGTHTATVELEGAAGMPLSGVAVSRGIAGADVVAGRWCVLSWRGQNPAEAMVLGVY